ncbi:MAG: S8 family serine peptidase [Corynebacterium matruchotii]|jgi:putative type VII secretion-associated serine protease mycosin|uniref:S8 family serine peptidase n=1 Tax=Corynebacterium matruchotii TaxID=43768 RepID=UPI00288B516C|nr:S8 family serine peptidase [Corynebacterium matruchotii]
MIRRLLTTLILWILVLTLIPPPTTAADPPPTTSTPNTAPKRPTDCATTFAANPELIKYQAAVSDHYRDVHKLATGMGVTIGIIDTGVAPHPRLPPITDGGDFLEPKAGATVDCDAHGTIVAGVIAAHDTGDGIVGVAPDAAIMSFRQTSSQSKETDTGGTLATLTTAINAAIDKKVQVINISVVSCLPPGAPPIDTREFDAAIQRAEEHGIVIVAAAGNMGNNCQQGSVVYPAHHTMVVGVTATSDSYQPTEYSIKSPHPTISALGTVYAGLDPLGSGLSTGIVQHTTVLPFEGTSFAAPMVTGTVALLRQRHPSASAQQIRNMLFASVDPSNGTLDIGRVVQYVMETQPSARVVAVNAQPKSSPIPMLRVGWVMGIVVVIVLVILGLKLRTQRRKA